MGKGFLVVGIMWIGAYGKERAHQDVRCCQREGKREEVGAGGRIEVESGRALWARFFLEGVMEDKTSDKGRVRRCPGQSTRLVQEAVQ